MGDSVIARGAEIGSVLAKSVYAAGYGKKERACKFPVCSCEIGYPQGTPSLGGAAGQLLSIFVGIFVGNRPCPHPNSVPASRSRVRRMTPSCAAPGAMSP